MTTQTKEKDGVEIIFDFLRLVVDPDNNYPREEK